MWSEKLQEMKNVNAILGKEINDGATDEDIQKFVEKIGDSISDKILNPYVNVLKRVNGLEFNGFFLYGIDSNLLDNKSKQPINGFIDNNKVWHETEWQREYIFLADSNISWYTYDLSANKFYELDKPSGEIVDEFDDIDLLVDKLLGDALLYCWIIELMSRGNHS